MTDTITVTGAVGNDPRVHVTSQGLAITSFRLASTRRYFDRAKGAWEDGETNWYTVSGFRQLANNAATSIRKGDRVVVHGRLRLRAWDNGEKSGTAIEIEAEAIGHDLTWGTTVLTKVRREPAADAEGGGASEPSAWPGSEIVAPTTGLGSVSEEGLEHLAAADEVDAEEAQPASAV